MRVLCPSCQKLVTLPDSAAGQSTPCPLCSTAFVPPALTGYAIDAAPPPVSTPAPAPPRPYEPPPATIPATPSPAPSRSTSRCCTMTLRKDVVRWIAPVALFLVFVFSFFTWLAAAPNGNPVYTQNGWKAASGSFTVDVVGDEVLAKEAALKKASGWNGWLVLYWIVFIPTLILAVGSPAVALLDLTVPDAMQAIWPHRGVILFGLTALLVVALAAPMFSGFGLETAGVAAVEQAVPAAQGADGAAPNTKQTQLRDLNRDVEIAKLGVRRTWWLCLTMLLQLTALLGAGLSFWLERRGNQAEPHAEFYC